MPNRTPIYGLPMPTPGEYVNLDVTNEVTQKTESGMSDPAKHVNPCTAAYDAPAKRHILTLAHRGLTLPGLFSARFQAAAGFSTGDKVCLDGVEYVPAYTDSSAAVATGAWASGAAVTLTLDKSTGKAYVGRAIPETAADVGAAAASHGHPISQVTNLNAHLTDKANRIAPWNDAPNDTICDGGVEIVRSADGRPIIMRLVRNTVSGAENLQICYGDTKTGIHIRLDGTGEFASTRLATATPPAWYVLPLAAGLISNITSKYCRDNVGMVTVSGAIVKPSLPQSGETFASLPSGFRPSDHIPFILQQGGGWATIGTVSPSGNLNFFTGSIPAGFNQASPFYFSFVFPAAS